MNKVKQSKILVYSSLKKNTGTGNLIRMLTLSDFLRKKLDFFNITFFLNDYGRYKKLFPNKFDYETITNLSKDRYDLVLFDTSDNNDKLLKNFKKISKKTIAFDYFNYSTTHIDVIINIINHNYSEIEFFRGKLYEGLDFVILRDSLLSEFIKPINYRNKIAQKVLITFGGEDPSSNTLKTLNLLTKAGFKDITVLVGKLNRESDKIFSLFEKKYNILHHVNNIEKYYKNCDAIICGGGTTMLEALYAGKPVIPIPQNINEQKLCESIAKQVKVFSLEELINSTVILNKDLISSYRNIIDGKGKERICKIIVENLNI